MQMEQRKLFQYGLQNWTLSVLDQFTLWMSFGNIFFHHVAFEFQFYRYVKVYPNNFKSFGI